jgi:hypothetical protein
LTWTTSGTARAARRACPGRRVGQQFQRDSRTSPDWLPPDADRALLQAHLRGRAYEAREHAAPRRLRPDQASAVWHALTSARTVVVITGPVGTGKTRVLTAIAEAWDGPVIGSATSQDATNELRRAGVQAGSRHLSRRSGQGRMAAVSPQKPFALEG